MSKQDIERVIISVLREIQEKSGRPEVGITKQTCPIGDLPDFDSLNGLEATVEIASRLGCEIDDINLFVDEAGRQALPIEQVAERLAPAL